MNHLMLLAAAILAVIPTESVSADKIEVRPAVGVNALKKHPQWIEVHPQRTKSAGAYPAPGPAPAAPKEELADAIRRAWETPELATRESISARRQRLILAKGWILPEPTPIRRQTG